MKIVNYLSIVAMPAIIIIVKNNEPHIALYAKKEGLGLFIIFFQPLLVCLLQLEL